MDASRRRRIWMTAAGLAGLAIPILEWGARLAALLVLQRMIVFGPDMPGERGYSVLFLYNLPGFYLPALLLAVFNLGLRRILDREGWRICIGGFLWLLSAATLLAGILPYAPDLPVWESLRGATRLLYFWCLPLVAILIGMASLQSARYGQFVFSTLSGFLMAAVNWLSLVFHLPELISLVISTFWYLGTGCWLLRASQTAVEETPARYLRAALNILQVLTMAAVAASIYPVGRVLSIYLPVVTAQASGRIEVFTLQQDQFARTYRVYRPVRLQPSPGLIIVLHGSGGNGLAAELDTRFDRQADRLGWIAAYPDGISGLWNAYGCCNNPGVDDVKFLSSMVSQLEADHGVNPDRVYITGFSLGAMLAYRAACELSDQVTAIAPVAGNMATVEGSVTEVHCQPGQVVSVLAIHGSEDQNVPIMGGKRGNATYASMNEIIDRWRQIDGCGQPSASEAEGVRITRWTCRDKSSVETRIIIGGGHMWPGSALALSPGSQGPAFDASPAIADFFAEHARPATP